jgi:hypothetical protein
MSTGIQLGSLSKLTKEDQWVLWLEDLTDIIYLNGLDEYYNQIAVEPTGLGTEKQKAEFIRKHETVRAIIHSALSTEIRERMKHHGYDRTKHKGKDIIDYAEKSVKLISGNMDKLYNTMWKDLRRTDFKTWNDFCAEFRRLYGKLRETGQEVTAKSACIHLFDKVRMYLPIWAEINEARYFENPDVEKLLLELETRGRQLEYEGVSLANLKANGDKNPKEYVSDFRTRGAEEDKYRKEQNIQTDSQPQGQGQGQRQSSAGGSHQSNNRGDRNHRKESTPQRERRYCERCDKSHPGDCWAVCGECEIRHHPKAKCRNTEKPRGRVKFQDDTSGPEYSPAQGSTSKNRQTSESSRATESVFRYNINAICFTSVQAEKEPLTRESWIYDTGASFHICNDWLLMEDVVQGEPRTTTTANGGTQSGNLFGRVKVVVKCANDKRVITLNDVLYIPESPCNLVSEGTFYKKGLYLDAQQNVIHNGKEIVANCPRLECANVRTLEIDEYNKEIERQSGFSLVATKAINSSFEIWHQRLLHAGEETVVRTMKAMGIDAKKPQNWTCRTCMLAKPYKQISREIPVRSEEACAELHTDTIPMKPQGLGGFNYCLTVIDSATLYTWMLFLIEKGEAGRKLHDFVRWLENQSGKSVKVIVRDGGKEYSPTEEKRFAREKGIEIRESAPRTPEQNGKAEIVGRHIVETARAARINAGLPEFLWPQAVTHAVDVRNLTPKKQLGWKTPHEVFGKALNLPEKSVAPYTQHLRIFGCEAYVKIPEEDPEFVKARKTKERARKGQFVGTEGLRGHIFVVWIPEKRRLFRSRDVQFREEIKDLPEELLDEVRETEEESTYRITIPNGQAEEESIQKPAGSEDETSEDPTGYRYATPDSIAGGDEDAENPDQEWYPEDIDPEAQDPTGGGTVPEEQEDETSEQAVVPQETEQKKAKGRKDKIPQEPTRSSSRKNKGEHNDAFAKEHFITYVSFVAA